MVLSRAEVSHLMACLKGQYVIIAQLFYGAGMRLMELVRLRVKDVDFAYKAIIIRDVKGSQDRVVMLPDRLIEPLHAVLLERRRVYEHDVTEGVGGVFLPHALSKKYPHADKEWIWQYVFAARGLSQDPRTGVIRRHHIYEQSIQRAIRQATRDA